MTDNNNDWIAEHPQIIFYAVFLFIGSLFSIYLLARKETLEKRIGKIPLSPWKINRIDFILFLVTLILWAYISGPIFIQIHQLLFGAQEELGTFPIVVAGFLLQAGMLYIFFRFRFHFRTIEERPLNENPHSIGKSFRNGFLYFLASFPIIVVVGAAWTTCLELLRQAGFDINLPIQETITMFQDADSIIEIIALTILAVLVAPVVEEFVFRAGVYRFLRGRFKIPFAMLISGSLFGLVHGNLNSLPGLITVGACLALAYENSRDIKVPIVFHALFNLNSIIWIIILPPSVT